MSGEVAADELAPWAIPTHALVYAPRGVAEPLVVLWDLVNSGGIDALRAADHLRDKLNETRCLSEQGPC